MKQKIAFVFGVSICVAACHKVIPVASTPSIRVPVQQSILPEQKAAATPARLSTPVANKPVAAAASPAQMTPQERITLNERLARLEDALFDYDRATIRPDANTVLRSDVDVIRGILANYPLQKLLIEGHADQRGSDEYNLALGDKRASAAEEFLKLLSVPASQLTIISYGKERPVCTQQTENCWQKNRRIHISAAP